MGCPLSSSLPLHALAVRVLRNAPFLCSRLSLPARLLTSPHNVFPILFNFLSILCNENFCAFFNLNLLFYSVYQYHILNHRTALNLCIYVCLHEETLLFLLLYKIFCFLIILIYFHLRCLFYFFNIHL